MANVDVLLPFILYWEGGFVNDKDDKGGATNMGVTLSTWQKIGYDKNNDEKIDVADLKIITKDDVRNRILKPHYWDRWRADEIEEQGIANMLVDWTYCSGKWGIVIPQRVLNVEPDGIVGKKTINAVNGYYNQMELFNLLKQERLAFVYRIVERDKTQKKFLNGWVNRINSIKFNSLNY